MIEQEFARIQRAGRLWVSMAPDGADIETRFSDWWLAWGLLNYMRRT